MIFKEAHSNIGKIIATFLLLAFSIGCDNEENSVVPYVPVSIELDLISDLANLGVGQLATITPDTVNDGYAFVDYHNKKFGKIRIYGRVRGNGLLIYRKEFSEYQAFDLTCTYKAYTDYCAVEVEGNEYLPKCPCCQSIYMLQADALPSNTSKASVGLHQYNAVLLNNGTKLRIVN